MEESIDFQISLCPIVPLCVLALTLLALARMFLSLVDVIAAPQLWVSPDPEYRHLFAPLPRRLRRLMGIHPLFIAPPRSYMIVISMCNVSLTRRNAFCTETFCQGVPNTILLHSRTANYINHF
jgi:hypothetical protein